MRTLARFARRLIRRASVLILAMAVAPVAIAVVPVAMAGQTAVQESTQFVAKVLDTLSSNDKTFEATAIPLRKNLNSLAKRAADLSRQMDQLPGNLSDEERHARQERLRAETVHTLAQFVEGATALLDGAEHLVSGNMVQLQNLSARLEQSSDSSLDKEHLRARITAQIAAGKNLYRELLQLKDLAERDPRLAPRFQSLATTLTVIDRKISSDRTRLAMLEKEGVNSTAERLAQPINAELSRLGDLAMAIRDEKQKLADLRDETALGVQLGLAAATTDAMSRAMPHLLGPDGGGIVDQLSNMMDVAHDLNERAVAPESSQPSSSDMGASSPSLVVPNFKNLKE